MSKSLRNKGIKYANDVVKGKITAGRQVVLMCKKFLKELAHQDDEDFPYYFSEQAADRILFLDGKLQHYKGKWAGMPFFLAPFQIFILMCIFGWRKKEGGKRRYTRVYLELARKNGKTFLAALIAIYMLVFDGEGAPEIYCAATMKEQAKIAFSDIGAIVKASKFLSKHLEVLKPAITFEAQYGKIVPLASDTHSLDGLNVSMALCDEVHQWKTRDLYDVLVTGTGSRDNPLMLAITTAGFDRTSLCWKLHDRAVKIAEGLIPDDGFFGMIWAIDKDDDIKDPKVWIKANPCLGVSKSEDTLIDALSDIEADPSAMNNIKRLHFGVWTRASVAYFNPDKWAACGVVPVDEAEMKGRRCYGGIDLSSTLDISAYIKLFEPVDDGEPWKVICNFYIPLDTVDERSKLGVPYRHWVDQGLITATPGTTIDYDYILQDILEDGENYEIVNIVYDRYLIKNIINDVEDVMPGIMIAMGQGVVSMNAPMRHLMKMILDKSIAHGNNEALAWMASNTVAEMNRTGMIMPSKSKSTEKIDGISALINAVAASTIAQENMSSAYEDDEVALM